MSLLRMGYQGTTLLLTHLRHWPIAVASYLHILLLNEVDGNECTNRTRPVAVDMNNGKNLINQRQ